MMRTYLVALLAVVAAYFGSTVLRVGVGFVAKTSCSALFVQERTKADVFAQELSGLASALADIEIGDGEVTAKTLFGLVQRRAVFLGEAHGCALARQDGTAPAPTGKLHTAHCALRDFQGPPRPGPVGAVDTARLRAAVARQFAADVAPVLNTRAILVVHNGKVVAEQYGPGISPCTRLLGWSMTKSLTSALVGLRVQDGKMSIEDVYRQGAHGNITLHHLLTMSSGLDLREILTITGDTTGMLFIEESSADFAHSHESEHVPGETWTYTSGTTNIISHLLRDSFADDGGDEAYWSYPAKRLFGKLRPLEGSDEPHPVMERDAHGTLVGSSFSYLTARDWARFGLLFLRNGKWYDEELLSPEWVEYSHTPVPPSQGVYGAQWWIRSQEKLDDRSDWRGDNYTWHEAVPEGSYYAHGYEQQVVLVAPSHDLVVVRLGLTKDRNAWDAHEFFRDVFAAVEPVPSQPKETKAHQ